MWCFWGIKNKSSGMTLIELAMVIAIAGILIGVAFFTMNTSIQTSRLQAVTENFYGHFQQAYAHAVNTNSNVYLSATTGNTWCYGISSSANCDCSSTSCQLDNQVHAVSYTEYPNISFSSTNTSGELTVNPLHGNISNGITTSPATYTFTTVTGDSAQVSITNTGFVSKCSSDLAGYTAC